jgi:antitoxin component of MazEF toxin-antitoxin module
LPPPEAGRGLLRVSRWGASLGLRLSKRAVGDLGLKTGDELSLVQATGRMAEFEVRQGRERAPSAHIHTR